MRNTNLHVLKMSLSWKSVILTTKTAVSIPAWLRTKQDLCSALGLCLSKVRTQLTSSELSCSLRHDCILLILTMLGFVHQQKHHAFLKNLNP